MLHEGRNQPLSCVTNIAYNTNPSARSQSVVPTFWISLTPYLCTQNVSATSWILNYNRLARSDCLLSSHCNLLSTKSLRIGRPAGELKSISSLRNVSAFGWKRQCRLEPILSLNWQKECCASSDITISRVIHKYSAGFDDDIESLIRRHRKFYLSKYT